MKEISKQDIETLVRLQEAETEIVRLQSVLEKVENQKKALALKLKKFETAFAQKKEALDSVLAECRSIEQEIQMLDDRIVKSNENLRMVKTNKEYQVLLREVDDNKKRKDSLETELLKIYETRDSLQSDADDFQKEYQLLESQVVAEQGEVDKKSVDDKELLDEYVARQREIGETLDPVLKERFMRVSKMNKGLAVAGVRNGVCQGCFMNVPPQLYIEVQRAKELISCPQCSRILYYEDE